MKYEYSENVLVQDSAAALMHDELGWDVVFAYNQEVLGENGTLGRKDYHEIVLWRYFNQALKKLNPWITDAQITEARQTLSSYLSSASLLQINEEKYFMIRDGIPVTVKKPNGKTEEKKAIVIDFNDPDNNFRFDKMLIVLETFTLIQITIQITRIPYRSYSTTTPSLCFPMVWKRRSEHLAANMNSSTSGSVCPRTMKVVWRWKPCSGVFARRRISLICMKTSSFMIIPMERL